MKNATLMWNGLARIKKGELILLHYFLKVLSDKPAIILSLQLVCFSALRGPSKTSVKEAGVACTPVTPILPATDC